MSDGDEEIVLEEDKGEEVNIEEEGSAETAGGDKPSEGGDDKPKGDKRLSGAQDAEDESPGPEGETDEQRRERRKQERKAAQANKKAYVLQADNLVYQLTRELRKSNERLAALEGKTIQAEAREVESQADYWRRQVDRWTRLEAKAIAEGDANGIYHAKTKLHEAQGNFGHFMQLKELPVRRPSQPEPQGPGPAAQTFIAKFMERNPWFDPNGEDRHSRLARQIDAQVLRDGYDMNSPDYWEELEDRLRTRLPANLFEDDEADDEPAPRKANGQFAPREQAPGQRKSPPTVARSPNPPKPNTIVVPRALKEAMQQAGQWDDPKVRNEVLRDYQRLMKEQQR
jgi:hypothetical protein